MAKTKNVLGVTKTFVTNVVTDCVQPRARKFNYIRSWLESNYRWVSLQSTLPTIALHEIYPDASELNLSVEFSDHSWALPPTDMCYLSSLILVTKPQRIFELGTFEGATTRQLAKYAPDSEILTIDLPPSSDLEDLEFIVGRRFKDTPEAANITQLYGDSTNFDFSPYYGTCDFVFIDAMHKYEYVKNDSQVALKLLKPEGGLIVWDDYATWAGVRRAVDELPPLYDVHRLANTRFAFLKIG